MAREIKQKLICVSNDNGGLSLTIGNIYGLEFIDKHGNYNVIDNNGNLKKFWHGRFRKID